MNKSITKVIGNIIDDAENTIGYWASRSEHNAEEQSLWLWHSNGLDNKTHETTLSYDKIFDAIVSLASGKVKVNSQTRSICREIVGLSLTSVLEDYLDIDYDADDADVIIQVAIFGDIIFG